MSHRNQTPNPSRRATCRGRARRAAFGRAMCGLNVAVLLFFSAALVFNAALTQADTGAEKMKPFVLASEGPGEPDQIVQDVSSKLSAAGFEIVGTYTPYSGATIVAVTNTALKRAAGLSKFGGYGAAQRVSITTLGGQVQVAYTNPRYMAAAYRMKSDLAFAGDALAHALGAQKEFGPKDGLSAKALNHYHYMFTMPYFDDPLILGGAASYGEMTARIEKNLAAHLSGVSKVYRIDIPGKNETVFGVAMKGHGGNSDQQDDHYIMKEIDFKPLRSTAHLPYEILVSEKKAYALSARFRIAIDFPDLSMMGDHSFLNIMGSPVAIQRALTTVAGGTYRGDGSAGD
ncbi:hypothetical protein [Varunaivibrio sulfuroxidans]|uniref:Uncharacterized protein n=1 Tax=Varunaivibrio sulfuroxidans TaxID=1773489 RepID=A0A4R3JEQ2_9PROT|nr:hypothetical protein [Varunaivibrio sulfuroxidans]TCS63596.1 hypothetical protein EDD55_103219 [Varunaivibrio sulfuroxidans]WES30262.1 hypothetical protein P3M64_11550 [Varunaivibrio sulfuroxidans]